MKEDLIIGVDIGGSHVTAGLVDMETGRVEDGSVVRKGVDPHGTEDEIVNIWADAIRNVADYGGRPVKRVGFAMPGPFDYENGVCVIKGFDKYESLYGLNIKDILNEKLGFDKSDIRFRNDAEAFLEGEIFGGVAKGFKRVVCITLGTGLGSAKKIDGIAGEANLNVYPFKNSTAEEHISTRWFVRRYFELSGKQLTNTKALADAFDKDEYASVIFKEFGQNIAAVLKPIIKHEKPEIIVLGGNISHAWDLFVPQINADLIDLIGNTTIVKSKLDENAALIGAACCFLQGV